MATSRAFRMTLTGMVVLVISTATSGCVTSKPSDSQLPLTESAWPNPQTPANELLLTNCIAAQVFLNYPSAIHQGERPEGWEGWGPRGIALIGIDAFKCERIAVAGYERGPIHLLLDRHDDVAPPPDCRKGVMGGTHFAILRHLVVDDPEIAAHIQSAFGVPTLLATFGQIDHNLGASAFHDLNWSIDGDSPSVVTVFDEKSDQPLLSWRDRFFWQVGNGLGTLDVHAEGNGPPFESPANGTIQPPMLLASDTGGRFVGDGAWYDEMHVKSSFSRYADLACKEPLG